MAPDRQNEIVYLGPKYALIGVMVTCRTGAVVGILL